MDENAASNPAKLDRDAGPGIAFWVGLAVLMCAVAVALAVGGPYIYRRYHAYRGGQIARAATELLHEERWESASQLLREGVKIYGKEPAVLRAVGSLFLDAYDDPLTASHMLRQVLASGHGTPEDLRRLAEALFKLGDLSEARKLYDALPGAEKSGSQGLELLANILRRSGRPAEADALLRKALSSAPDDPRSQLRLALLDEAGVFEVSQNVAAQAVWTIARRNDAVAVEAILHLGGSRSLTALQARELLTLVEQNPRATPHDRFRVLSAYLRMRPLEREAVIAAEIRKHNGKPVSSLFDLLRWLGVEKQYDQIVEMVPASAAVRDPDVFLVYVDAMAAAERWAELLKLVQSQKIPASAATLHFISAECGMHLQPDLSAARSHIESVYALAGPSELPMVQRAADLSETKGLNDLAIIGYARVAEAKPSLRVGLLEKILNLHARDKNIGAMIGTLRQLRGLRPASHAYLDQLNYLRLLTGEELELACQAVLGFEQPAPEVPDSPAVPQSLLRALAALRLGDIPRLAREIQAVTTPAKLGAGQRAVVAGLRALTGDDVGAYRIAESVPRALLLEEERGFLRRAGGMAK